MNEKAGKYMGWMNKLPIIIDPDDSDIIYLGHLMGVSISKDGGKTWDKKKVAPGICNLYMNPNNKKELVAGSAQAGGSGGVYIGKDGGETWEQKLKNRTVQAVDVDPTDFRMMYAGTNTGNMEKSNDGGLTWRSKKPAKDENLSQMPNILGITINPVQPNVILLAANLSGVFISTDGGETWNPSSTGSNIDRDIKYNPTNPSEIWGISNPNFGLAGGAGSKVYFSNDAGKKFIDVGADETITDFNKRQYDGRNAKFNSIYFSPDGKRVYLCTSTGVIYTDSRVVE
ncbi:MAG: hypothetical protein H3C31_08795 [Brumimicrobium sp.]|nr:hypothetical protein [Brumimicrobium sp.]